MHHSRLSTLMIDCLDDRFEESVAFWSRALGMPPARRPAKNQRYLNIGELEGPLRVSLQRVDSNPGYHLDIETDAVPAEVERLEKHGGRRKYRIKRWWVMEDPSGNAFCVIRPESEGFPAHARTWGA